MNKQKYLSVEFRVMFNIPVREDFDIDNFSGDELEDIAIDYFVDEKGYDTADYLDFEFDI